MKKNFLYYLSPSIITGILGVFVIVPLTTYYLDPKDFGIVAIIMVFSGLLVPLSSTGVVWVLSGNYYKINTEEKGELVFNMLFLGIVLRTFWLIVFGIIGHFFLDKVIRSYEEIFSLFFYLLLAAEWFNSVWELVSYVIVLEKKSKTHAFLEMAKLLSRLIILVICLVVFKLRTISLIYAYLGAALIGFVFSLIYIRKHLVTKIKKRWIKEIFKVGFPTIPLNFFEVISNSVGRFFVERWIGLSQLGIYSHSLDYKKMFMLFQRAFAKSYSPEVLAVFSGQGTVKIETVRSILRRWFGILSIVGVGVALFSENVINILTHGKFTQAAPLVSLWFILIVIYAFGIPYTQFLLVNKKNKLIVISQIILGIISWGLIALFVKLFGIVGAAVSVLLYFFAIHFTRRAYSLKLGCECLEGKYFIITLVLLVFVVFAVNVLSLSLLIKFLIFTLAALGIIKFYNLFPKLMGKQC